MAGTVEVVVEDAVTEGIFVIIAGTVAGRPCTAHVEAADVPASGQPRWAANELVVQNPTLVPRESAGWAGLPATFAVAIPGGSA